MTMSKRLVVCALLSACLAGQAFAATLFVLPSSSSSTTVRVFRDDPFQSLGSLTVGAGALAAVAKPNGSRYYIVSNVDVGAISVFSESLTLLRTINLSAPARAAGVSPDGRRLVVLAGALHVFDISSTDEQEIALAPAPDVGEDPDGIAFSLDSKRAFILSTLSDTVTMFNLETNTTVGDPVTVPGATAIAAAPNGQIYVSAVNRLFELGGFTGKLDKELGLNGLPGKAAFTPDGRYAVLPNQSPFLATGLAFLVNLNTRALAGTLGSTGFPAGMAITQLAPANETTLYGVSRPTGQLVRLTLNPADAANPMSLATAGFLLADQAGLRAVAVSNERPQATYLYTATADNLSRGAFSSSGIEQSSLSVAPATLQLAAAVSTGTPTGYRVLQSGPTFEASETTQRLILQVWSASGLPVFNKLAEFSTAVAGVTFEPDSARTNADGYIITRVTLPATPGLDVPINIGLEGWTGDPIVVTVSVGEGTVEPGTGGLSIYSGNGQVVKTNSPTKYPLRVRLATASGAPIEAAVVEWSVATGGGSLDVSASETGEDGVAEATFRGEPFIPAFTSYRQSTIRATASGLPPVTFTITSISNELYTPQAQLLAPAGGVRLITGQAGQTTAGVVKVQVKAFAGLQAGQGIANVGLSLLSDRDPAANPSASCVGLGGTALSDSTGTAICDVRFGGVTGGPVPITVDVGGYTSYQMQLTVTPGPPGEITILGGNNQTGGPGTLLPAQLSAEIHDSFGHRLPGTPVTWEVVTPGTATIESSSTAADGLGRVSARVRLGGTAGLVQVRLRAGSAEALFSMTVAIPVGSLVKVSGDGQSALINQGFGSPLTVEVRDAQNQPIAGALVSFAVASGSATVASATATTGANGRATVNVTAGSTPGAVTVQASISGFSVTFNLTVNPPISSLNKISGDGQSAVINQNFQSPLVVELRDQQGAVVAGGVVSFAVVSGSATLGSPTATSGSNGQASTSVRAGATAGAVVVRATSFTFTVTFNLTVVPPGPEVSLQNIRSAVSGDLGVTPGGITAIYGLRVAPGVQGTVMANNGFLFGSLPTALAGVEVLFGSTRAPIYHVNNINGQEWIVVQAPFSLSPGTATSVTINAGGASTTVTGVEVKPYQPGIFETQGSAGLRWAVLTKEDGSTVSAANPIRSGVDRRIRMYCAGLGQTNPALATNGVGLPGQAVLAQMSLYILTTDGSAARVASAEPMIGVVGVYVVTIDLPAALQAGSNKPLTLGIAGPNGPFTYLASSLIERVE